MPCLSDAPHLRGKCPTNTINQLLPQNFKITMECTEFVLRKNNLLSTSVCTRTQMEDPVNLFRNAWYPTVRAY
jgi:hypothetical protein